MDEREGKVADSPDRWLAAVRVEVQGPGAPPPRGSSRLLSRCLSTGELADLHARLRIATEQFLEETGALHGVEDGWAEALSDGSWAWEIEEASR